MSILLLGAAFALNTAQPNYILNEPASSGSLRTVLLECTPYPYGRSRVISRDMHATPDFLVDGAQVLSRTPADRNWCAQPGPAWYGAPADAFARAHAWVGQVPISFDPFAKLPVGVPGQLRRAQSVWLNESGLVNQARLVRRAVAAPVIEDEAQGAMPEPIMIIPKPQKKTTKALPLEVYQMSPTRLMITDGSVLPAIETAVATE